MSALAARDRWSAGRLVAAAGLALAAMGAANVMFQVAPPAPGEPVGPVYLAAAAAGALAGWAHLGRQLGRGFAHAMVMGLGAAGLAALYALLAGALRDVVHVYSYAGFSSVMRLLDYMAVRFLEHLWTFARPRPLGALAVGAMIAGVFAEHYHRLWR
ncbi:TrgA family protein [Oceanicella actignis]|uniref:Uncharacterized protein n=1 Tax=Oceanicella actignis TaxID=1189325 RepID=A0A1M7TRY5_9RHOB|nr:TrgA family protein [Oceanicella actignis]TYO85427.1 hypothetical protein LY05_02538 [Oceanicella actignis]SET77360.1 hypothetical protein SAMN04488119_10973 [Oceanicella actignis]SHN73491.1 hypothetical protein SAMN05216200_10949 [Oceanicella actignis]